MSIGAVPAGSPRRRQAVIALAAAALAAAAAGGIYGYRVWSKGRMPVSSLAVLPFEGCADRDWFCAGLTADVIDALARIPGLRVIGRDSVFLSHDAARLGAETLLTGTVEGSGAKARVHVALTRAGDGSRFWTHTFEAARIEREISPSMARRVAAARGWKPHTVKHTPDAAAWEAYIEGRASFGRGDIGSLRKAIERLEKATDIDGLFAPAWAWLSLARSYLVEADAEPPNSVMPGARDAAERAATLDPELSEGHTAKGIVLMSYDREWEAAKQELDRAVELSPGAPLAHYWRARWFQAMNRANEALAGTQAAQALDPLSPRILSDLTAELLHAGQVDRAAEAAAGASPPMRIAALCRSGKTAEAASLYEAYRKSLTPAPLPGAFPALEPYVNEARSALEHIEELRATRFTPADTFAMLAATTGDRDAFFDWADTAYDERSPHLAYWRWLPGLPVSDPRFAGLMQKMNLPTNPPAGESKGTEGIP